MRRRYDVAGFERAVALVRSVRPDVALTGDLMVGFPGETDADFEATVALVERARFADLHVFRYSARPRTAAARYAEVVPVDVGRERSRRLIELGRRLRREYAMTWEGRPVGVIWDRVQGEQIRGVTENYLQVRAPAGARRPGQLEEITWRTASSAA
jgi:tRNA A37 methylthiotransferase MiaB